MVVIKKEVSENDIKDTEESPNNSVDKNNESVDKIEQESTPSVDIVEESPKKELNNGLDLSNNTAKIPLTTIDKDENASTINENWSTKSDEKTEKLSTLNVDEIETPIPAKTLENGHSTVDESNSGVDKNLGVPSIPSIDDWLGGPSSPSYVKPYTDKEEVSITGVDKTVAPSTSNPSEQLTTEDLSTKSVDKSQESEVCKKAKPPVPKFAPPKLPASARHENIWANLPKPSVGAEVPENTTKSKKRKKVKKAKKKEVVDEIQTKIQGFD